MVNRPGGAVPAAVYCRNAVVGYRPSCPLKTYGSATSSGAFNVGDGRLISTGQIDVDLLAAWLAEPRRIQWEDKTIVKREGGLVRLT